MDYCFISIIILAIQQCKSKELNFEQDIEQDLSCGIEITISPDVEILEKQNVPHKVAALSTNADYSPLIIVSDSRMMTISCNCCQNNTNEILYTANKKYIEKTDPVSIYNKPETPPGMLVMRLVSENREIVSILREISDKPTKKPHTENKDEHGIKDEENQIMYIDIEELIITNTTKLLDVTLETKFLGKSRVTADLLWMNTTSISKGGKGLPQNEPPIRNMKPTNFTPPKIEDLQVLILTKGKAKNWTEPGIEVTVILSPNLIYEAFDWGSVTVVIMCAFSIGTCTNPVNFKEKLKRPLPIIIGTLIQTIITPGLALVIAQGLGISPCLAFGQLVVAAMPGGGLAHLLVFLVQGDRHLSAAMSFCVCITNIITGPFWILVVGYYKFGYHLKIERVIGWIAMTSLVQCLAIISRRFYSDCAKGILTWITRPLLLLSAILLITLGIYINHYIIHHLDTMLIISLLLVVSTSFSIGWIAGYIFADGISGAKTLATETSFFNGLLSIVLVRTSLQAPDGDLAATAGFWMTFVMLIAGAYHTAIDIARNGYNNWRGEKKLADDDESQEFGATSMAAISAASLAVTPAVAISGMKSMKKEPLQNSLELNSTYKRSMHQDPLMPSTMEERFIEGCFLVKTEECQLLHQNSAGPSEKTCQMIDNEILKANKDINIGGCQDLNVQKSKNI